MRFIDYTLKLNTIKKLAEQEATGSPMQLALKIHVSERTVQRMVQQLREHGYPIKFNRATKNYEVRKSAEKNFTGK